MLDHEALAALGAEMGFTHTAPLKVSTIELKDAVRDMCAANSCGQYGKNWACPPGCGTLDECRERVAGYEEGILVQTVGELEDPMDGFGMMEAAENTANTLLPCMLSCADSAPMCWPSERAAAPSARPAPIPTSPAAFPTAVSPPWRLTA